MSPLVSIILVAILAADVFWWRWADRRVREARRARVWRLLVALFAGGQIALVVWVVGARLPVVPAFDRPPPVLSAAGYLWHLLVLPLSLAVVATAGLLSGARRLARLLAAARTPASAEPGVVPPAASDPAPTRRQFQTALVASPALLTVAGAIYSRAQVREFRVRELAVPVPALPPELDGLRIALVSDLHVGGFTHGPTVQRVVEETNRLDADLVLLPGDLIDHALAALPEALDAVCAMRSRHGAYLCVGNHDLIEDGATFVRRTRARVPLLVGDSRSVTVRGRAVQLLGLPWYRDDARTGDAVRELAGRVEPGAFPILLAHHPHAFDAAAAAGIPLTVSGHTHGGQLMLGEGVGFGPLLFRYWSGLYRKPGPDGAALVVSNGAGNWFPLRVGAPAEIVHLILQSENRPVGAGSDRGG